MAAAAAGTPADVETLMQFNRDKLKMLRVRHVGRRPAGWGGGGAGGGAFKGVPRFVWHNDPLGCDQHCAVITQGS